jgi:PEP-CTERM motif
MNSLIRNVTLCALLGAALSAKAVTVGVDPTASWIGYMNVFNLPVNGGGYQSGSVWGTADLCATFSGSILTLTPNTIGDTNSYWYTPFGGPGATGNKTMDANMYVEKLGTLSGQTVTFTGNVMANTLVNPYTSVAFIKDFAPDYSSFNTITAPLVNGVFSINLATVNDPLRHVQYGFETIGPDVWVTDVAAKGLVQITAVPEPATFALIGLGSAAMLIRRRRN